MPDTIRDRATLLTSLADNTTGAITPQVARDMLISVHGVYGSMYAEDNTTAQTFNIAPAIITCFNTATGFNGNSAGVTCDKANNKITVLTAGVYRCHFNASIVNGANGSIFKFYLRANGTEQAGGTYKKCANNDVVNVSCERLLVLAINTEITVYGESDTDTKAATLSDAMLNVHRIA